MICSGSTGLASAVRLASPCVVKLPSGFCPMIRCETTDPFLTNDATCPTSYSPVRTITRLWGGMVGFIDPVRMTNT